MGLCGKVLVVTFAVLAALVGWGMKEATAPETPVDPSTILAEGGNYVTLRDGRILEYFTAGRDDAPKKVIFIHGAMMSGKFFQTVYKDYVKQNDQVQVISPSLPGYGRSSPMPVRDYKDFAQDIRELVTKLGVKKFHVAGISFGSPHACTVGVELSDMVESVILLVPSSPSYEAIRKKDVSPSIKILEAVFTLPVIKDLVTHYYMKPTMSTKEGCTSFNEALIPIDWAEADFWREAFLEDNVRAVTSSMVGWSTTTPMLASTPWPSNEDLAKLTNGGKRKVTLLAGTNDRVLHIDNARELHRLIEGSQLIEEDGTHLLCMKNREYFYNLMDMITK